MIFGRPREYGIHPSSRFSKPNSQRASSKLSTDSRPDTSKLAAFKKKQMGKPKGSSKNILGEQQRLSRKSLQIGRQSVPTAGKENSRATRLSSSRSTERKFRGTLSRTKQSRANPHITINQQYYNMKPLLQAKKKQLFFRQSQRDEELQDFEKKVYECRQQIKRNGLSEQINNCLKTQHRCGADAPFRAVQPQRLSIKTNKQRKTLKRPSNSKQTRLFENIRSYLDRQQQRSILSHSRKKKQRNSESSELLCARISTPTKKANAAPNTTEMGFLVSSDIVQSHVEQLSQKSSAIFILNEAPESATSLEEEIARINSNAARHQIYLSDYLQCRQQLIELEMQDRYTASVHSPKRA